jgi:hypothetical protein
VANNQQTRKAALAIAFGKRKAAIKAVEVAKHSFVKYFAQFCSCEAARCSAQKRAENCPSYASYSSARRACYKADSAAQFGAADNACDASYGTSDEANGSSELLREILFHHSGRFAMRAIFHFTFPTNFWSSWERLAPLPMLASSACQGDP